jgi:photosystem II stability/assembly factor-like uncharacterized protein
MSSRPLKSLLLVLLFFATAGSDVLLAQWTKIGQPSNERLGVIYFRDEFNGFIGYRVGGGQVIAKTTDAGASWHTVQLEFSTYSGDVSDIFMVDDKNGWATCDATDASLTNRGLYRTTDGGLTWKSTQVITDATSVVQVGQSVYVTSRRVVPVVPMVISRNGGSSWQQSTPTLMNDLAFVDAQHGVGSRYERGSGTSGNWYRTSDGGANWIAIPNMDESWSVYGEPGTPNFYATPEDEPSAQNAISGTPVIKSTNYGQTWTQIAKLNFHSTGHLAVANGIFYFQVSDRNAQNRARAAAGIYRSMNKGVTWVPVGGPASDPDTRFCATGCLGGIVYASDMQGNLWKTRNGGDGSIKEPPFTLEFGSDTIRIASLICDTKSARFNFRNLYCSPDSIVSIELESSEAATSGAIALSNVPSLPKLYKTDEGDHFDVNWDPSKMVSVDTTIFVKVRLKYFSTVTHTLIDTSIVIAARAQGAPPTAMLSSPLAMGDLPSCATTDSLFVITNTGCDTLYINSPAIPAGSGVSLSSKTGGAITYPIAIAPGRSDTVYVLINRTIAGPFTTNVVLPALHQKIASTFTLTVTGNIVVTGVNFQVAFDALAAQIDSALLDRGKLTRCDPPQEFYLYIRNPGCTGVALRNVMFEGDGKVFTVTLEGSLPDTLLGDDMHRVKITVSPAVLGVTNDRLRVRYKVGDSPSVDLFYPFTVDVGYGTRLLSLADYSRDLDTIEYCQTRDSVIRFQNTGCDTLTITDASLNGADFDLVPLGALPRKIAPGAYDSVVVRYDPLLPGDAAGQLTLISDADTLSTRAIDVMAFALPTDTVTFRLIPDRAIVNDNDTLNFNLVPDTTIRGKGLRSLSMILSYNGDVLTFMSANPKIAGLTILPPVELQAGLKARQLAITLLHPNDITLDSLVSLVSLRFRTTLSDSTQATMSLSQFELNSGDPRFAKCVLGSKSEEAKLTLALYCGDSLIKKTLLMNRLVLSSSQPWPNPSQRSNASEIHLPYVLNIRSALTLRVYSLEGVLAYEETKEREVGEGTVTIPATALTSGIYHYTLTCEGSQVRGQFIVAE